MKHLLILFLIIMTVGCASVTFAPGTKGSFVVDNKEITYEIIEVPGRDCNLTLEVIQTAYKNQDLGVLQCVRITVSEVN